MEQRACIFHPVTVTSTRLQGSRAKYLCWLYHGNLLACTKSKRHYTIKQEGYPKTKRGQLEEQHGGVRGPGAPQSSRHSRQKHLGEAGWPLGRNRPGPPSGSTVDGSYDPEQVPSLLAGGWRPKDIKEALRCSDIKRGRPSSFLPALFSYKRFCKRVFKENSLCQVNRLKYKRKRSYGTWSNKSFGSMLPVRLLISCSWLCNFLLLSLKRLL